MALMAKGYEYISSTVVVGLTAAKYKVAGVQQAHVQVDPTSSPIRYLVGAAPAAAGGDGSKLVYPGGQIKVVGLEDMENIQFIPVSGTALLNVDYYGAGQ